MPSSEWPVVTDAHRGAVTRVLDSGCLTRGVEVRRLEEDVAALAGRPAVAASSGTAAIELALRAAGIGRRDVVGVPAWGFPGTALAVLAAGAHLRFWDVDDWGRVGDLTRDVDAAVLPHFFGVPDERVRTAEAELGVPVVEDACQTFPARYRGGSLVGSVTAGGAAVSFNATKMVWAGEGGAYLAPGGREAEAARSLRRFGFAEGGDVTLLRGGRNYQLSEPAAALARVSLSGAPFVAGDAARAAQTLRNALSPEYRMPNLSGETALQKLPVLASSEAGRLRLERTLRRARVPISRWQAVPLARQFGAAAGDFPGAESLARRLLILGTEADPVMAWNPPRARDLARQIEEAT